MASMSVILSTGTHQLIPLAKYSTAGIPQGPQDPSVGLWNT